jgi:hypothetical protein
MKASLTTRFAALFTSAVVTLVMVGTMALLGHPQPEAGAELAMAGQGVVTADARL